MRKAQIQGQIIVYILGIIVVGMVLIYGYTAVKKFVDQSENVAYITFSRDIKGSIQNVASDYGSVRREQLHVPSGVKEVCFVDLSIDPDTPPDVGARIETGHPLVDESWRSPSHKTNIFLIKELAEGFIFAGNDDTGESYVQIPNPYYVCIPTASGKLRLRLEGKGNAAIVSQWI